MKIYQLLPFTALAAAFVVPTGDALARLSAETQPREDGWYEHLRAEADHWRHGLEQQVHDTRKSAHHAWAEAKEVSHQALDAALEGAQVVAESTGDLQDSACGVKAWLEDAADSIWSAADGENSRPKHPHHPKDPHHQPNLTVYQLIAGSKYTTKLAKLINEYDDLVSALNSTKANYTVFAPTDSAFDKIPDHAPKPSKEFLKALLEYHVVPDLYPAKRVLVSHTAPTLLKSDSLGYKPRPQRIAFKLGLKGLTVNFYSRIVAINIIGTNGVIHGVDSLIVPPPSAITAIDLFPGEFSTLELGLQKTGLLDLLNTTDHAGGTLFAPSNFAFKKLGPRANAFLFSRYGLKYLKALLEYHVVPDHTLYSDAYYDATKDDDESTATTDVPKGVFHVDLPTLLEGRHLAVDVARYGALIEIKINAFARVAVQDGIVQDGVIHVVGDVLVPPKKLAGGPADAEWGHWEGDEIEVEDLVSRLSPYVPQSDL